MHEANRLKRLPPYLFTVIDQLKAKARASGIDVIDLGMGSPDQPCPKHVIDELCKTSRIDGNQRYSRVDGEIECKFRKTIAEWYKRRFDVDLDPDEEVLPLIGSKEGIAHLSLAFLNNDDIALVPNPAYPVHFNGVIMAGGILYNIPITAENGFKPKFEQLSPEVVKMAKLLFLSYPHNPTAAVVDIDFFEDVIKWVKGKNIIVGHDLAYSEIVFGDYVAPSLLQVKGAKDVAIEFHTLSKSYNMAGWRIGFAVGNKEILKTLAKTKSYIDFGIYRGIQAAAIKALTGPQDCIKKTLDTYERRRDVLIKELHGIGWDVPVPQGTFYVWGRIPLKYSALTSMEFAALLIEEAGVALAPGTGFGEYGEGYVRFALVEDEKRIKTACDRIKKLLEMEG
ncbi:LL-diaminopimelate aminotransferase [Omnitrophica bacterium]|nr:LL-diaminopimelate aminotransferase [Candidatus Omnitrophota bacterium]